MTDRTWTVAVGSDDAGYEYKEMIRRDLEADPRVTAVVNLGVTRNDRTTPYPAIGRAAARNVAEGVVDRAILVCGTGIGMAISANKVKGIRATTAHDSYSVERSVLSNDCQVLTIGQRVVGPEVARRLAREWLDYVFDPDSASQAKVALINAHETEETA